MEDNRDIARGFDKLSSSYVFLSRFLFGKSLLKSQYYFVDKLKGRHRILLMGVGTGELLLNILEREIAAEIVCVDISERMLEQTKSLISKKLSSAKISISYVCCTAQDFTSDEKFDLIFFPYLLDCLQDQDIQACLSNSKDLLSDSGKIIFTDFQVPQKSFFANLYAKIILKILYLFFNTICKIGVKQLPDFNKHFAKQGFRKVEEKTFYASILISRMYVLQ